jgi:hypothetical protein
LAVSHRIAVRQESGLVMSTIKHHNAASMLSLAAGSQLGGQGGSAAMALKGQAKSASDVISLRAKTNSKEEVREKFTQFVGETFYGQMFKAMRSTVGKPAYMYGGRGEEVFQKQLDQTMSQQMTKSTASKFADPMFERQFPNLADSKSPHDLSQLSQLRRQ